MSNLSKARELDRLDQGNRIWEMRLRGFPKCYRCRTDCQSVLLGPSAIAL